MLKYFLIKHRVLVFAILYSSLLSWSQATIVDNDEIMLDKYYDVLQGRVLEKLDEFMNYPKTPLEVLSTFQSSGGFPYDLQAPDRKFALKYLHSFYENLKDNGLEIFYALDNGLILGYFQAQHPSVPFLVYREPGNSGFIPNNNKNDSAAPIDIYYDTCINSDTGEKENCNLKEDELYVSCINNCALVRCEDPISQTTNCSQFEEKSRELMDCESEIKWCRNYKIKTYDEGGTDKEGIGYVPLSYHCYNAEGDISQSPGDIVILSENKGVINNGDCNYGSGKLVSRYLSGPFAQCADYPNGICNSTFTGAYMSRNYDPRFRGWYRKARELQVPVFSGSYVFFSSGTIGITYSHPIHFRDREENKNVFYGVAAVDISLQAISKFLEDITVNSPYIYAIYEDKPPHTMLGISTGSELIHSVSKTDNSRECTLEEAANGECTTIPLTITDLGHDNTQNIMLQKAHSDLEVGGYTSGEIVVIPESEEDADSVLYVGTSRIYEQPGQNLKWRVLLVWPLTPSDSDSINRNEAPFLIICALSTTGFLICILLFSFFCHHRKERAVRLLDFQLTSAFILGCGLVNLSMLSLLGKRTDVLCNTSIWVINMSFFFAISPLIVRVYRLHKLVGKRSRESNIISNKKAWIYVFSIPLIELTILTIFTLVDPIKASSTPNFNSSPPSQSIVCVRNNQLAFDAVQNLFLVLIIGVGCILGFLTRNIDGRFGDVRYLLFALYNIAFIVIVYTVITFSVDNLQQEVKFVIQSICIFMASVFSSAAFIVPTILAAKRARRYADKEKESMRAEALRSSIARKTYSKTDSKQYIHSYDETLKLLICSANMGNAVPTLSSMKAWIPEGGSCENILTLESEKIKEKNFHIIVIGMQEATWGSNKDSVNNQAMIQTSNGSNKEVSTRRLPKGVSQIFSKTQEDSYLASVHSENTIALQHLERSVLGSQYISISQHIRGQMRLHIYALIHVAPLIENIKVSGTNTGVGNVLANKGGIVVSLEYQRTRFTFLSAHLAAHEGESYYETRCNNMQDILRASQTYNLSKTMDVAITSHHMFVLGDLNFRTKFESVAKEDEAMKTSGLGISTISENEEEGFENTLENSERESVSESENLDKALKLIENEDWSTLYSYDELSAGLQKGHLLHGFDTLPCNFHPTFKVLRSDGFVYNKQRTPSYTDRILHRSAKGLHSHLKPLVYESCPDFITSDHKPIRGAYSVILNKMIQPVTLQHKFEVQFSDMECSDLRAGDVDGSSDPYIMTIWDGIEMVHISNDHSLRRKSMRMSRWPRTTYISKTLHPKWIGDEITLTSTSHEVCAEATIYLAVLDYDFATTDTFLGAFSLSVPDIVAMLNNESRTTFDYDRPLEQYGKPAGRIKFKLRIRRI